jgi:LIVCS family branched-chain amino acid:cation transporter
MSKNYITVGFAIFTMFFGAGNMVLPLYLMQKWPDHWLPAFVGFCITAVFFTLLGLIGSVLVQGNIKLFFAPLGTIAALALQIVLIAIEGPFGIVPRSLIVAYGSVESVLPINSYLFYALTCIGIYFLALNKDQIIKIIGNIVTPVMLIFLVLIVLSSFMTHGIKEPSFTIDYARDAFLDGLSEGYLTYDLPGALYFTGIAMVYLTALSNKKEDLLSNGLKASLVSATLLILVYSLFIYLGLSHHDLLQDTSPELILPTIVKGALGPNFSYIFASLIFLACSTTAVAAISIWTDFIHYYFPKFNYKLILGSSLVIAFMVSSVGFTHLMQLLTPVLNFVYPILVFLAIYSIVNYYKNNKELESKIT